MQTVTFDAAAGRSLPILRLGMCCQWFDGELFISTGPTSAQTKLSVITGFQCNIANPELVCTSHASVWPYAPSGLGCKCATHKGWNVLGLDRTVWGCLLFIPPQLAGLQMTISGVLAGDCSHTLVQQRLPHPLAMVAHQMCYTATRPAS